MTATLQKKAMFLIPQKATEGTHVAPLANFTFENPNTYVTNKRTVFDIDINPVYSYIAYQTYC